MLHTYYIHHSDLSWEILKNIEWQKLQEVIKNLNHEGDWVRAYLFVPTQNGEIEHLERIDCLESRPMPTKISNLEISNHC